MNSRLQILAHNEESAEVVVLRAENLTYRHRDGARLFEDVSLELAAGRHTVLVGTSGCGKTTLLRCLAGKLPPGSGTVNVSGRIAVIHQDLRLVGESTALQNVLHGALGSTGLVPSLCGFRDTDRRRATELLARVGLAERAGLLVKRLSGGERQRVAIARALMQSPSILLADEPVTGLDDMNAHAVMRLLRELAAEQNVAVLSVLHNRQLARQYGDRTVELGGGCLTCLNEMPQCYENVCDGPGSCALVQLPLPSGTGRSFTRYQTPLVLTVIGAILASATWLFTDIRWDSALPSLATFIGGMFPGSWPEVAELPWGLIAGALLETLHIALVATLLGALIALPCSVLAARNIGNRHVARMTRAVLTICRTIPALIWALVFVASFGLGPAAGVAALTTYTIGYLAKFFYESLENIDPRPLSALKEIGASSLQTFYHAVLPLARPALVSSGLFMLEYNVRSASVLGIVGAGGIGFLLREFLDYRAFPSVLACIVVMLVVVLVIEHLSGRYRKTMVAE